MALYPFERIAFFSAILIRDTRLNDLLKPGSKTRPTRVRHKITDVIAHGHHDLLDHIPRFLMRQAGASRCRVDKILIKLVELVPPVLIPPAHLRKERWPRFCAIGI